ncbi:hypothetical protein GOP47_0027467 [Adiantum capillus-veneris]|nr:hypothetical protein GOP47_0027467 [Adiantum capillus-veneris]
MDNMWQKEILHAWLFMLCLLVGLSASSFVQLNDDVLGLIVFKADLMDPTNALSSWTEDDDSPCNWTGIACNAQSGRVISVDLKGLSLSGRLGRGLGKVSYLQNLTLAHNNLSGTIAADLAQLTLLNVVDLSHNMLSGSFNAALGSLPLLRSLDFSYNLLSGIIPEEFFTKCRSLRYLSLRKNLLEGSIPHTIGSCARLRALDLAANKLDDSLPRSIARLFSLRQLDVSYNLISGFLPAISPNLVELRLQNNKFSGALSPGIGKCSLLQHVDLSNNLLSSELPSSIRNLSSLTYLKLSNNILFGNIPIWISNLESLRVLNLSYNALYGQIPASMGSLRSLEDVDLSHNKLSGSVPLGLSSCPTLKRIDLSSNFLIGSIPEKLIVPSSVSLKLTNNLLTGELPKAFFDNCESLETVDLAQNQLKGVLPSVAACAKMVYVNMSNNFLSGEVFNLGQGNQLQIVDLSHNNLSGSIAASIGNWTRLAVLSLEVNNLNGLIPSALGECTSLTDINLKQNNLQGSIPPELGKLKQLEVLDLSHNNLSGMLPPELGQAQKLAEFNVSYNHLQGSIPETGMYLRFNMSAYVGNMDLCGANVNVTCPNVMPKPIVLNPNTSMPHQMARANPWDAIEHRHMLLSASAILAIAAAAAISAGVVIVMVLNGYAQTGSPRSYSDILPSSFSPSLSPESPGGKLVMFAKNAYPRAEEWITTAHDALLNKESELGRGGFGTVYKVVLGDGRMVAIKKLMPSAMVKTQAEFEKEMQVLGSIKHRNLLELQGYYWTPQLQLLIYDFIPNGNLYTRLHERTQTGLPLSWARRFKIALGTARGLAHLHHACHPQVIHYVVKSSNILLDNEYNPQISDYGLAKLLPMLDKYLKSSKYQSALGYMAPELACQSSKINEKCDVYGYGVMVLELVTGRRPVEYREDDVVILCDYVRALLDQGKAMRCVDRSLGDCVEDEVLPVIKLGLICTSQVPSNRPSMAEVVQILELIKTPGNSRELL